MWTTIFLFLVAIALGVFGAFQGIVLASGGGPSCPLQTNCFSTPCAAPVVVTRQAPGGGYISQVDYAAVECATGGPQSVCSYTDVTHVCAQPFKCQYVAATGVCSPTD